MTAPGDTDPSDGLDRLLSLLVVSVCCQACEIPGSWENRRFDG
jgi:hypothetical protein